MGKPRSRESPAANPRGPSALCQAACAGDLSAITRLVAEGAPLDGSDGERYLGATSEGLVGGKPMSTPLGMAARMGHVAAVRLLLDAGAPLEGVTCTGETALTEAVASTKCSLIMVRALLDAGADVDARAGFDAPIENIRDDSVDSLAIADLLLAHGARLDRQRLFTGHTGQMFLAPMLSLDPKRDVTRRALLARLAASAPPKLRDQMLSTVSFLDGEQKKVAAKAEAERKRLVALGSAKATAGATWASTIKKMIGPITTPARQRDMRGLCEHTLVTAASVARPEWPTLVKAIVGASLAMRHEEDDAGHLDEHAFTYDWVLGTLSAPPAIAHPKWASLVMYLCEHKLAKVGLLEICREEIAALFSNAAVQRHPEAKQVEAAARRAFPASYFTVTRARPKNTPLT